MGKPTEQELQHALETAVKMREQGLDPDFIAKSLLNLNYRFDLMMKVLAQTKLYLHSGESPQEHSRLVRAIEKAEAANQSDDASDVVM